jgi:cyanophycinase
MVLAGSGEYTSAMDIVDKYLLDVSDTTKPILLVATSCALEGQDVMEKWEHMGQGHFARLGADATPVRICDRADADNPEYAEQIRTAGIIWFSGGSPTYLAQSFHGTLAWRALEEANRNGAAVAGSSGGLGVLNVHVSLPNPQGGAPPTLYHMIDPNGPTGLGLAAPVRAMAHFDRMEARRPENVERTLSHLDPGQTAVGVDEDTAIVWSKGEWRVMGHKRAVVYAGEGGRTIFMPGDRIGLLPPPVRAQPAVK